MILNLWIDAWAPFQPSLRQAHMTGTRMQDIVQNK